MGPWLHSVWVFFPLCHNAHFSCKANKLAKHHCTQLCHWMTNQPYYRIQTGVTDVAQLKSLILKPHTEEASVVLIDQNPNPSCVPYTKNMRIHCLWLHLRDWQSDSNPTVELWCLSPALAVSRNESELAEPACMHCWQALNRLWQPPAKWWQPKSD